MWVWEARGIKWLCSVLGSGLAEGEGKRFDIHKGKDLMREGKSKNLGSWSRTFHHRAGKNMSKRVK